MKKRMLSMAVVAAAFLCFGSDASAQKTTKLFNGKDLSGWNFVVDKNSVPGEQRYLPANWRAEKPVSERYRMQPDAW